MDFRGFVMGKLFFVYVARHIRLSFPISTDLSIVLLWRRAHLWKEDLCYLHTGTEDDRYRVHICELEGDIEVMTRIDKSCSIVHDETESSKRWLSWELDEVFLGAKFLDRCAKYRHSGTEDKSLFRSYCNLFIGWEDFIHGIDRIHRIVLHDEELGPQTDIVARWLKSGKIEISDRDISSIQVFTDVRVWEVHILKIKV